MATQQSTSGSGGTTSPGTQGSATITLPIGNYTGVFDLQLLAAIKGAKSVSFTVHRAMRQERDFKELSKYTSEFVIGKNGPGYGFTIVLDNKPFFISPPVWPSETEVREAMPGFLEQVKSLPLMTGPQATAATE
jgi:hypothetical protein